jgi:hypothetical protein
VTQLALTQGAYQARGVIANAQVCKNLYPEPNPEDAPFPVTHYPAPGLRVASDYAGIYSGAVRGLYQCSTGAIIAVVGGAVINWPGFGNTGQILLGTIVDNDRPVSICDNGTDVVLVDGEYPNGWTVSIANLTTPGSLSTITDPAWFGSARVDYIDTFFVFNRPGTSTFYTSTSGAFLPLDATYATPKVGWNDQLIAVAALHDNVWLLGNVTSEVWFNSGGATFPFARMPNAILQQGCVAKYSPVIADNALYWLGQDRWGRNICLRGEGYAAKRVSTFAVEDQWSLYGSLDDAMGMVYQIGGHEVVGYYFPGGNAWWGYDTATGMWHQRTYGGTTDAWLPRCMCGWGTAGFIGANTIIAGDRTAPRILELSRYQFSDCGTPITRQRSWPHVQQDGKRLAHTRFAAAFDGSGLDAPDQITLDWSDDAGHTYGTGLPQTVNNSTYGQYQWRRLGYARDRVYRLTWSKGGPAALNGAWVDVVGHGT